MRSSVRRTAVSMLAVLASVLAIQPADAQTRTFKPATSQRYLESATVTSTKQDWRFEVQLKRVAQIHDIRFYLDTGGAHDQHDGPEFLLQARGSTIRLRRYPTLDPDDARTVTCGGKTRGVLTGNRAPGLFITVPQKCLTYFLGNKRRVDRLRANVAVIGEKPDGDSTVTEISYAPSAKSFSTWIANRS